MNFFLFIGTTFCVLLELYWLIYWAGVLLIDLYRSHGYLLTLFHPKYIHTYLPIHIRRETAENISINQDNNTTIRKWCFVTKLNNLPKKQEARTHSYRQLGLHKQGKNTSSKETDWGFLVLFWVEKAWRLPANPKFPYWSHIWPLSEPSTMLLHQVLTWSQDYKKIV